MTFLLLYARFGIWGTEKHKAKEEAINSAINGASYGEIFAVAIANLETKTFELLVAANFLRVDQSRVERYLLEMTGEKFLCAGDLTIEMNEEEDNDE